MLNESDGVSAMDMTDWELEMAKLRANQSRMVEGMEIVKGMYEAYAKQYKAYYDALVAQGFTSEQAMEIVKAHGWIPR